MYGMPHMHPLRPARAHFLGHLSPEWDSQRYGTAVADLARFHAKRSSAVPLVVNTCGWIKVGQCPGLIGSSVGKQAKVGTASQSLKVVINAQAPVSVCCRDMTALAACCNIRCYCAVPACVGLSNIIPSPHGQCV